MFRFEGARPKRGLNIGPFLKISQPKSVELKKKKLELDSARPFYPILIPNNPYVIYPKFLKRNLLYIYSTRVFRKCSY